MDIKSKLTKIANMELFRAAGTYGFFSLINSAIPFFLLPVLTRYLTPEDYGYVSVFNILLQLAVAIFGCNLAGAYNRAYFAQDRYKPQTYFGTTVLASFWLGAIGIVLFVIFRKPLANLFTFPASWMWLVPVAASATAINAIILSHWQVRMQPRPYGLYINTRTLFQALLSIFLITVINLNWKGQVFATVIAPLILVPIGLAIMRNNQQIDFVIDKACLKHALYFGIPLIPHALAGILNSSINRIFIAKMVSVSETGLYTVGFQLGMVVNLFAVAFNQAYAPWLFKKLNENSEATKRKIVKFTYGYFVAIFFGSLLYGLLTPYIFSIFIGKNFHAAFSYVVWIALGYAFNGMYFMVVNYIFYIERTPYLAAATVATALLNIALTYIFIKFNGGLGAAQATTIAYLFAFLLVWAIAAKLYKMPWNLKREAD